MALKRDGRQEERRDAPSADEILVGRNAVFEALKAGRGINRILVAQGAKEAALAPLLSLAREQGVPVEAGLVEILLLLDDCHVHLVQEGTDRLLHPAPLHRRPAVLHGHALTAVVGEGEIRIPINQLPNVRERARLGAFLDDVRAVVA